MDLKLVKMGQIDQFFTQGHRLIGFKRNLKNNHDTLKFVHFMSGYGSNFSEKWEILYEDFYIKL